MLKDKFAIRAHSFSTYTPYDRFLELLHWVLQLDPVLGKKLKECHEVSIAI